MAKKEILTDDGKLEKEEIEMEEAKRANKELGLPDLDDDEKGRKDSEPDGEGGTKKASDPKSKKSKASAKQEEVEEEEVEEAKDSKKEGEMPWDKDKKDDDDEDDEDDEDDKEESKAKKEEKEELDVDVSEDVSALNDGEELSEEFKTKAATIFEAAVKSKIAKIRK